MIEKSPTSNEEQELVDMYVQSLPEKKHKAYFIAKSHLGSTFNTLKSVGFLSWKKNKDNEFEKKLELEKKQEFEKKELEKKELELQRENQLEKALEKVQEKIKIKIKTKNKNSESGKV